MKEKTITFCQVNGNLNHNNKNSNSNITFIQQSLEETYQQIFQKSIERYNIKQTRKCRKIQDTYFKTLFKCEPSQIVVISTDKRKSFYEIYVQIGSVQDTAINTEDSQIAIKCLTEYFKGFQERNPNFYVFNAVIHLDELTPHLHINYVPIGHFNRGIDTQNSISQALREMGYTQRKESINQWRIDERTILEHICINHNISVRQTTTKENFLQLEEKYQQNVLELSTLKQQLTQMHQDLNKHIQSIEETSILDYAIINPVGYKEKKKGILSNKIMVEMDIEAFKSIQQMALKVSKMTTFDYDTLKRIDNLLKNLNSIK